MLTSRSPLYRRIGLRLLCRHRLLGTAEYQRALSDPDADLRNQALQSIGESGEASLLPHCLALAQSGPGATAFWAARSAILLGERQQAIPLLLPWAQTENPHQAHALRLLANAIPINSAQSMLTSLAQQGTDRRLLVQLAGELGDPASIPALLRMLADENLGRLAGQAFSTISGLDLVAENMERPAPENTSNGPNDDANDEDVTSDPDENLPWPDPDKLQRWWSQHDSQFQPGIRYLQGFTITPERCHHTWLAGMQPQRITAALQLKLQNPAQPMLYADAPAWRQH